MYIYIWVFFQFITEGLALVLFMKITGMNTSDDIPEGLPKSTQARKIWLRRNCRFVVDQVNNPTNADDVQMVIESMNQVDEVTDETDLFPFCFCRKGTLMCV